VDAFLAIASRRDERRYRSDPLSEETATRILDAGRLSGSASNRQPWTFVVPAARDRLERVAAAVFEPGNIHGAGLVVAVVVSGKGPVRFDAGRAAQNMLLAAWNAGVSSCPNGIADAEALRAALALEEGEEVAIVLSFGLPERMRDVGARSAEEWSARANRKPLEELVRRLD
jgi:nitroreductase